MTSDTINEGVSAFLTALSTAIAEEVAAQLNGSQAPADGLLTMAEVGERLAISERAARKLVGGESPVLASMLIGDGARRVEVAEVERYKAERRQAR